MTIINARQHTLFNYYTQKFWAHILLIFLYISLLNLDMHGHGMRDYETRYHDHSWS